MSSIKKILFWIVWGLITPLLFIYLAGVAMWRFRTPAWDTYLLIRKMAYQKLFFKENE